MRDTIHLPEQRHVIGLRVRTTNANESNPATARIGQLWQRFMRDDAGARIPNRVPDAPVMAVYTDYESDQDGEYSLTIGCHVSSLAEIPDGMIGLTIAAARYAVFPVNGSDASTAVPEAWQRVWAEFSDGSAGTRAYTTDFEEYGSGPGGVPAATLYIAVA